MQQGLPLPKRIAEAPELERGLELYYTGFWDLASSRATPEGPIGWEAIVQYCERLELDEEQTEAMVHHVQDMDTAFQKHHAEAARSRRPAPRGRRK